MRKAIFLVLVLAATARAADPDPSTLDKKVLLGYQGWFNCAGDGAPENHWRSWARGVPAANNLTIDMIPTSPSFPKKNSVRSPA